MNIKLYFFSFLTLVFSYASLCAQNINISISGQGGTYSVGDEVTFSISFENTADLVEVPSGANATEQQISDAIDANNNNTAYDVRPTVTMRGTDVYGNDVLFNATINGAPEFDLAPEAEVEIEGSIIIPRDGSLHTPNATGHRINLEYDYLSQPSGNTLGPFNSTSASSILVDVPANLRIESLQFPSGTYVGGDIIQISATVRNERPALSPTNTIVRPLDDVHRITFYLTEDASLDTNNDYLLGFSDFNGDSQRSLAIGGTGVVRHVAVSGTPGTLTDDATRDYNPQEDDGWLDIGEEFTARVEVMIPHNYIGSFMVAAQADSTNDILNELDGDEEGTNASFGDQGDNIFVVDRTTLIAIDPSPSPDTTPVSEVSDSNGRLVSESDGLSDKPTISESGDWIAFHSKATNLDPTLQGAGNYNIYLRERATGTVQLISISNAGVIANSDSFNPAISADGRYIAYESTATNIISGTRGATSQIYVYDREAQRTTRVSISADGTPSNGNCYLPSIDSNGRFIVFQSIASNLDPNYTDQLEDSNALQVYVHDRAIDGAATYSTNYDTYLVSERGGLIANSASFTPKISLDGDVVVFASDSTNLGAATNGRTQIWMRDLLNGTPSGDISLVSVIDSTTATAGNGHSREPVINGGKSTPVYGLQIAFSSVANDLVLDDTNEVADIFVRDFSDLANPSTTRVSESNPRASFGTITFIGIRDPLTNLMIDPATGLATNLPSLGDTITLDDGINTPTTLIFGTDVLIGNVEDTRNNLITAINALNDADDLDIFAYASDPADLTPSILLYNDNTGELGNISGEQGNEPITVVQATPVLSVTGMTGGGIETGRFIADFELGEALGSLQPSIDRSGRSVAFRSLVENISVATADTRFIKGEPILGVPTNPTKGTPEIGELIRTNTTTTSKVYFIDRDINGSGTNGNGSGDLDDLGNTDTICASVNQFGGPTNRLLNTATSGSSRVPAISANGLFIAFASDATSSGGLRFDETNTQPLDTNNLRDVFLYSRPARAPIVEVDDNLPFIVLTNPTNGSTLNFSSPVFLNAGAFGFDESSGAYGSGGITSVEFFVNGESVGVDSQTPFSVLYQPTSLNDLRIFARAVDTRGNLAQSDVLNVSVEVSAFETTLLNLKTPGSSTGDSFSVGDGIVLESEILATAGSAQFTENFELVRVSYLVNGVSVYSTENIADEAPDYDYTYFIESAGTASINAMATYRSTLAGSNLTQDVFSETFTVSVVGIDVENNDRDFVNDAFERIIARSPTARERDTGLQILSSGQSRASYIATLLDSSSLENSATAALIYRTMLGEWPNKVALDQAIADVRRGAATGDANALTLVLLPQYEAQFSTLNTDLGFIQQTFFNKHGVSLSPQNQIRLSDVLAGAGTSINERIVPGFLGDNISYYTQFALDNDTSDLTGPNGLPLSNYFLYEMPNTPVDDLKIALAISAYLEVNPTDELVASYSGMSLEQAIERILSGESASSALASASPLGSDWYDSSWFGMFYMSSNSSNWVYSWRLGWVYEAPSSTPSAAWFYSNKLKAWLWSGSGLNGFYYHSSPNRKAWTYLLPAEADASGAWLYYFDTEQWQLVSP